MLGALLTAASNPTVQTAARGLFGFLQNQKGNRIRNKKGTADVSQHSGMKMKYDERVPAKLIWEIDDPELYILSDSDDECR